jgi:hypothetical protein
MKKQIAQEAKEYALVSGAQKLGVQVHKLPK